MEVSSQRSSDWHLFRWGFPMSAQSDRFSTRLSPVELSPNAEARLQGPHFSLRSGRVDQTGPSALDLVSSSLVMG